MNSTVADLSAVNISALSVVRGGRPVIDDVSVRVPRGSITGLLGPSGCGKTTLMRAIIGTQRIADGSVWVFGDDAGAKSLRGRIGYVTQSPSVYGDLTVTENIRYFADLSAPGSKAARNAAVSHAIEVVGLTAEAGRRAVSLSGGQRGRVSLACALVGEPELLVLDEPTVGLDPVLRVELWRTFADLAAAGTTLLVSSHVMDEAEHCANLILLREGRLVANLSPQQLLDQTGETNMEAAFLALIEGGAAR
nr:ABC transporter ATP-binding protein [Jongsikchunia kroppenstedtii]